MGVISGAGSTGMGTEEGDSTGIGITSSGVGDASGVGEISGVGDASGVGVTSGVGDASGIGVTSGIGVGVGV